MVTEWNKKGFVGNDFVDYVNNEELEIGKFYQVEVVDADDFDLYAKIINDYE